ncbi:MAG: hypothetical protein H8M99_01905, partial [Gloeobacteraceae cyanobacterium ES-bin-144]|nr:hypothetical protein [Verrucomicrobiales bacterium]
MTREQEILILQAVDGSLPAEQLPEFSQLLSNSEEACAYYCNQSQVQADIEWLYSVAHNLPEALTRKEFLIAESGRRKQKTTLAVGFAVAACLLLLATAVFQGSSNSKSLTCHSLRASPSAVYSIQRATPNSS